MWHLVKDDKFNVSNSLHSFLKSYLKKKLFERQISSKNKEKFWKLKSDRKVVID